MAWRQLVWSVRWRGGSSCGVVWSGVVYGGVAAARVEWCGVVWSGVVYGGVAAAQDA